MAERFVKIPMSVLIRKDVTPAEKLVYSVIVDAMRSNGVSWPGIRTIAKVCGLSPGGVAKSIRSLEGSGILSVEHRKRNPNLYHRVIHTVPPSDTGKSEVAVPLGEHPVPPSDTQVYHPVIQNRRSRRIKQTNTPLPPKGGTVPPIDPWAEAKAYMPLGCVLDCDEFKAAWLDWLAYRREARKRMTPATVKSQIAMLGELSLCQAIESIRVSIRSGWAGLFPPKTNGQAKPAMHQSGEDWKKAGFHP